MRLQVIIANQVKRLMDNQNGIVDDCSNQNHKSKHGQHVQGLGGGTLPAQIDR